jgi:hypothetical protein
MQASTESARSVRYTTVLSQVDDHHNHHLGNALDTPDCYLFKKSSRTDLNKADCTMHVHQTQNMRNHGMHMALS